MFDNVLLVNCLLPVVNSFGWGNEKLNFVALRANKQVEGIGIR